MKEVLEKQTIPHKITILRKDTVLISINQDSLKKTIDTTGISESMDFISAENYDDTASSQLPVTGQRMTGDTVPVKARTIQNIEHPLKTVQDVMAGEEVPYLFETDSYKVKDNNLLTRFGDQYYFVRDSSGLVYKRELNAIESKTIKKNSEDLNSESIPLYNISPDWLMGIVIVSLIVMAWLKLFFHKFINKTITSLWNFQLSKKEFSDQNIFSRRVAFILNLNFMIIGGLFIFLASSHFRINPFQLKPFLLYLFCTGLITIILLIRLFLLKLTGFIFNQQENFDEYLHQILLIYKNIGIFFIPLVIAIAYIQDNLRIYLIITGIVIFLLSYLFRLIKGIQIIIKKDILIFYLILYLCTLEILPVVIYCKFFSSWI